MILPSPFITFSSYNLEYKIYIRNNSHYFVRKPLLMELIIINIKHNVVLAKLIISIKNLRQLKCVFSYSCPSALPCKRGRQHLILCHTLLTLTLLVVISLFFPKHPSCAFFTCQWQFVSRQECKTIITLIPIE